MKNFKDYLALSIVTFFGIGFIPYVSGIIAILLASLIIFIESSNKEIILLICSSILIILYIPSNILYSKKLNGKKEKNVAPKAIGIWIVLSSPTIVYSFGWIIVSILLFTSLSIFRTGFDNYIELKIKHWSAFVKDLTAGVVSGIVLHVLYSGWLIGPYILTYLSKK